MKQIDEALQRAAVRRLWGKIEIDFRDGKPVVIRTTETTNISRDEENNRDAGRNTRT